MSAIDPLGAAEFPSPAPGRPAWLVTLADLGLLLVGFFVLLQANQSADHKAIARALRNSFGGEAAPVPAQPMPLATALVDGFAPGSAAMPRAIPEIVGWARDISRDDRTALTITGSVDGSAADVDPATGSGALLAADRARAVAAELAHALPGVRLAIIATPDPAGPQRRGVQVNLGFAGNRQDPAARQPDAGKPNPQDK